MKVAAIDFDGTLHHESGISAADVAALRAWRDAGHVAMCATGRSRNELKRGLSGTGAAFDFHVLSNGGAATTHDDELLFSHAVPHHVVAEAVDRFGDTPGLAICGTTWGTVDGIFAENTQGAEGYELIAGFSTMTPADIPHHTFAVLVFWVPGSTGFTDAPAHVSGEVISWIDSLNVNGPVVDYARNADFIDVMAPGRSKGVGLSDVFGHSGWQRSEIELYTFGDSWNDMSMHTMADISHSFRHSPADVRGATDHVIESVGEALQNYL